MSTRAAPVLAARSVSAGRGWQWIVDAWALTAGSRALFPGLVLALLVLEAIVDAIPLVGPFAAALLAPVLIAGPVIGCDALRRGETLKVDHLFAGFERQTRSLLVLGVIFAVTNFVLGVVGDLIVGPGDLDKLVDTLPGVLLGGAPPDLALLMDVLLRSLLAMLVVLALSVPLLMALWFAIPLIALCGLDVPSALKLSFAGCAENTLPFLVWSAPPLLLTIVIVAPLSVAISIRSLPLGLASVPLLLIDFVLLAVLTVASIYTSCRDVFALGDTT
jgi:hypothetical protein